MANSGPRSSKTSALGAATTFNVPSRKELSQYFDSWVQTEDAAVLAERSKSFCAFCKTLAANYTPLLVGVGVVEFAVEALKHVALDAQASQAALHLLSLVAGTAERNPEAHAQLVHAGAAQAAVAAAKTHPYEAAVQQHSLQVVATVDDDGVRKACSSLGAGKNAVQACNEHRFVPNMSSLAAKAVANCARNPATHQLLVASGVLPWATHLLSPTTINRVADADGACALCSTLAAISADRALAHRALEGNAVFDSLAAALRDHTAHEGVAEAAALAAHRLTDDRVAVRTFPVEAGLPAALVRAAQAHEGSERVVLAVVLALKSLCNAPGEGAEASVAAGAVGVFVKALVDFRASAAVQQAALWGASEATANASARGVLLATGAPEAAVAAAAAHEDAPELLEAFCALFSELLKGPAEGAAGPGEPFVKSESGARAVALAAHAMAHAPLSPGLQRRGCGVIAAAAAFDDRAVSAAAAYASAHALQALSVFGDSPPVQKAAAGALAAVFASAAAGGPAQRDAVETLAESGVVERLVDLTRNSSLGIQLAGMLALEMFVTKAKPKDLIKLAQEHDLVGVARHAVSRYAGSAPAPGAGTTSEIQQIVTAATVIIGDLKTPLALAGAQRGGAGSRGASTGTAPKRVSGMLPSGASGRTDASSVARSSRMSFSGSEADAAAAPAKLDAASFQRARAEAMRVVRGPSATLSPLPGAASGEAPGGGAGAGGGAQQGAPLPPVRGALAVAGGKASGQASGTGFSLPPSLLDKVRTVPGAPLGREGRLEGIRAQASAGTGAGGTLPDIRQGRTSTVVRQAPAGAADGGGGGAGQDRKGFLRLFGAGQPPAQRRPPPPPPPGAASGAPEPPPPEKRSSAKALLRRLFRNGQAEPNGKGSGGGLSPRGALPPAAKVLSRGGIQPATLEPRPPQGATSSGGLPARMLGTTAAATSPAGTTTARPPPAPFKEKILI